MKNAKEQIVRLFTLCLTGHVMRHSACLDLRVRSPRISGLVVNEDDPNEKFSLFVALFGVQLSDPYSKTVSTILEKKKCYHNLL